MFEFLKQIFKKLLIHTKVALRMTLCIWTALCLSTKFRFELMSLILMFSRNSSYMRLGKKIQPGLFSIPLHSVIFFLFSKFAMQCNWNKTIGRLPKELLTLSTPHRTEQDKSRTKVHNQTFGCSHHESSIPVDLSSHKTTHKQKRKKEKKIEKDTVIKTSNFPSEASMGSQIP